MTEFSNKHFPEDKDAPVYSSQKSFFSEFYHKNRKIIDLLSFGLIVITTFLTVSFSVYIVIVKYIV
ncbi:MAG TPA: hypothetical protein PKD83_03595 [Ignavibacteria bacterium]|nr:hypothetical protein [Ignavibacteria bacterium]